MELGGKDLQDWLLEVLGVYVRSAIKLHAVAHLFVITCEAVTHRLAPLVLFLRVYGLRFNFALFTCSLVHKFGFGASENVFRGCIVLLLSALSIVTASLVVLFTDS